MSFLSGNWQEQTKVFNFFTKIIRNNEKMLLIRRNKQSRNRYGYGTGTVIKSSLLYPARFLHEDFLGRNFERTEMSL